MNIYSHFNGLTCGQEVRAESRELLLETDVMGLYDPKEGVLQKHNRDKLCLVGTHTLRIPSSTVPSELSLWLSCEPAPSPSSIPHPTPPLPTHSLELCMGLVFTSLHTQVLPGLLFCHGHLRSILNPALWYSFTSYRQTESPFLSEPQL